MEQPMPIQLEHQVLLLHLWISTTKRFVLTSGIGSMPMLVRGESEGEKSGSGARCDYKKCPGLNIKSKRIVSYKTIYQCEQCTVEKKRPIFLCHTTKKIDGKHTVVSCHLKYHAEKEFLKAISSSECSLVSRESC
ncbi:MAG: hypothetical protein ACI8RD_011587 [Bacillariaceae sp.]